MCDHVIGMGRGSGESWLIYESKRDSEAVYIVYWFAYCPSCGYRLFRSFGPENKFAWDGKGNVCRKNETGAIINH